jgi:type III secretion system low calcium response chaperone LcrH/SycD
MVNQQEKAMEISQGSIETLYSMAYTYYKQGMYEEAVAHFRVLTMADASSPKHWIGLGASLQMLKRFEKALEAYEFAACLNPGDPHIHIHAADCLFGLGLAKEALFALSCAERAIKMDKMTERDKNLLAHIALIRKAWDNQPK